VRYFFRRYIPPFDRVVLIESGSRQLAEDLLPGLYRIYPKMQLDLVTCYAGVPEAFLAPRGNVYRVSDYQGREGRGRLYAELAARRHTVGAIICSGEPIMTKWKWMLALRLPAKFYILNENCDYFWLDWSQLAAIKHLVLFRAGLAGAGAVRVIATLAAFPLTLAYLLCFAAWVHGRRWWRLRHSA
jgi:hypothetical protein